MPIEKKIAKRILQFMILCSTLFALNMTAHAQADEDYEGLPSVVVLGDSLSAGYQLPPGDSYPEKLRKALLDQGVRAHIIGAGVSGDTTSGGLARLAWSVPEGTDGVVLQLGANDALRGLPVGETGKNLEEMIKQLQARHIKVLLIGMLAPPNMGEEYGKEFNALYPTLSDKYDIPLSPFFLDGVLGMPDLLLEDGIHPNSSGVDVMVEKTMPFVERLIEELRPSP